MYPCSAHIVTIVPHRSPLLLLLCPYIIIVMSTLIILWTLRLLYIERRYFHLYHQRIIHLCNVKEVPPSKRLNSKALIYFFYLFVSWFHNIRAVLWHKTNVIKIKLIISIIAYITVLMINGCIHVAGCRVMLICRGGNLFHLNFGLLHPLFPSLNYFPKLCFHSYSTY